MPVADIVGEAEKGGLRGEGVGTSRNRSSGTRLPEGGGTSWWGRVEGEAKQRSRERRTLGWGRWAEVAASTRTLEEG